MSKPAAPRLGKGLSALIKPTAVSIAATPSKPEVVKPQARSAPKAPTEAGGETVQRLAINAIKPNPKQPRQAFDETKLQELAQSIRTSGLIQPILVRPVGPGRYELVAGERRWRAAQIAELSEIPAIVRELSDQQMLELALVENLQREDLNPIERAEAYQRYLDLFHVKPEQLAVRLGESRSNVTNYVRLLKLNAEIQAGVREGLLSMGHARALLGVDEPERQLALFRLALRRGWSVRQMEDAVKSGAGDADDGSAVVASRARDKHLDEIERAFRRALGLPVKLSAGRKPNAGRIVIRYRNLEEFEQIADRLGLRGVLDE